MYSVEVADDVIGTWRKPSARRDRGSPRGSRPCRSTMYRRPITAARDRARARRGRQRRSRAPASAQVVDVGSGDAFHRRMYVQDRANSGCAW